MSYCWRMGHTGARAAKREAWLATCGKESCEVLVLKDRPKLVTQGQIGVAARKQWYPDPQTRGVFGSHSAPTSGGSNPQSLPMSPHSGSWPHLVKRGPSKVSPRFPVNGTVRKTAPSLGEGFSISLVKVPMLSTSPNVAKSPCNLAKFDFLPSSAGMRRLVTSLPFVTDGGDCSPFARLRPISTSTLLTKCTIHRADDDDYDALNFPLPDHRRLRCTRPSGATP
jgi:hypothetical protein